MTLLRLQSKQTPIQLPGFGNIIIRLVGSKEESEVANSIANMTRQQESSSFHSYARWNSLQHPAFHAISSNSRSPHKLFKVSGDLSREIRYWRFLDNWQGCLPLFDERHIVITSYSDASNSGWGGVFPDESGKSVEVRDYWLPSESAQPIIIREALALNNTLPACTKSLSASRVNAHVDSLPLVHAWTNQGGKSKALSDVIQAIYEATLQFNIALSLVYVPSKDNLADAPSRALSSSDCMLSPRVWKVIESVGARTPSS